MTPQVKPQPDVQDIVMLRQQQRYLRESWGLSELRGKIIRGKRQDRETLPAFLPFTALRTIFLALRKINFAKKNFRGLIRAASVNIRNIPQKALK